MLTFNKSDLSALHDKLQKLATKAGKKAVRQAARKAMVPVRDEVKANAPHDPTDDGIHIKANVALQTKWRGDTMTARVGIKGGAKENPDTPFYFRMHEFGTKHLPARPFLAPALEANAQQVLDTITAELKKELL